MNKQQRLSAPGLMVNHMPQRGMQHFGGENSRGNRFRQRRFSKRPQRIFQGNNERPGQSRSETDAYEFFAFPTEKFHRSVIYEAFPLPAQGGKIANC